MKATALYIAIFALALLTIPMIALGFDTRPGPDVQAQVHVPVIPENNTAAAEDEAAEAESAPQRQLVDIPALDPAEPDPGEGEPREHETPVPTAVTDKGVEVFRILDETTGEVAEVSRQDFVRGAVAAEMPASFHSEAMKAQAVAAHTYAIHNHLVQRASPDPALKGADFSADPGNLKVYITEAQAREFYGEKADLYWNKITAAADAVQDYVLEYEDEPIVAAYHAISAGTTEDASNVWTGSAPYLFPVESGGDLLAPDYETTVQVSAETLRSALADAYPEITLGEDPAEWFGDITRSGSGYVLEAELGDGVVPGKDIRQLLDLRSHNFDVTHGDAGFTFTVYGYGHGVGLSQYGADYLARQGEDYQAILGHYYTGTVLKRLELDADTVE